MSTPPSNADASIRVKIVTPFSPKWFKHQLPKDMRWGNCVFTLDPNTREYDWLVAYNNLPPQPNIPKLQHCEQLACHPEHTMLTTTEPSSITHYGKAFTEQFGCVLTSQAAWALPHRDRIHQQAGLIWLYGIGYEGDAQSFEKMTTDIPADKQHDMALVFSGKRMRLTQHSKRFDLMQKLVNEFPEMHVYGRSPGHISLDDKTDALAPYKYTFALENHIEKHHWTEKLADAFLGLTLPFYAGCPNASDYFPEDSFIPIDMSAPEDAMRIVRKAIANREFEKRLPAIHEARKRVLYEHNLFAVLSREIEKRYIRNRPIETPSALCSRHAIREQSWLNWANDMKGKARAKLRHLIS